MAFLEVDELEFVHALCQQVPARGLHLVRYTGVYANRLRKVYREARAYLAGEELFAVATEDAGVGIEKEPRPAPPGSAEALRRQGWARMLRKVFAVEPLLCPRCQSVEIKIVAWITDLRVVERILTRRRKQGVESVFETPSARAPPAA